MGILIGGPNNIVTSAVAADLAEHPSIRGSKSALGTVVGLINGSGSFVAAMGQKKGGRGRGSGRRHFVTSEEDLKKRNENQERYKATRAARRQDGEEVSDDDDENARSDDDLAEQMDAMRAGLKSAEEDDASKKKKKPVIETANPNAAKAHQKHQKASAVSGDGPAPELTRREREEIEKQRAAAAYAKRHAEGKTEEAQRDMERLREAKKRREEAAAKVKKDSADAEKQKALAAMEAEASKASSFFEVADGGAPEDAPKLESRKVKAMKPTQLKEELKLRGLSTQGNAKELQKRLIDAAC